jgi:hypothetical protein
MAKRKSKKQETIDIICQGCNKAFPVKFTGIPNTGREDQDAFIIKTLERRGWFIKGRATTCHSPEYLRNKDKYDKIKEEREATDANN